MTSRQFELRYKTRVHTVGALLCFIFFGVWAAAIIALICSVPTMLIALLFAPNGVIWVLPIVLVSVAATLFGVLATLSCLDYRLRLTSEGISFPLIFLWPLRGRKERKWKDVTHVGLAQITSGNIIRLQSHRSADLPGKLVISFNTGETAKLALSGLPRAQVEELLLAVEIWAKSAGKEPELMQLRDAMQGVDSIGHQLSYTQMWEDEMSRKFSATAFVPLPSGHQLQDGRLTVIKQLAFGGLSAIYLAQLGHQKNVVLKEFIVPEVDPEARAKAEELFNREATLLKKLQHAQISRVLDHFVEEGRTYLLLEHIAGSDLRTIVKTQGPQAPEKVLHWSRQIALVLEYLHRHDPPIIHRDVTPDNIVVGTQDRIVLIDFGAANEYVGTATGTLVGKQCYIAPEQFRGDTVTASDIYALGATMYFCLTGADPEPLGPSSPASIVATISPELDQLVQNCMAFECADRLASARQVADEIDKIAPEARADA